MVPYFEQPSLRLGPLTFYGFGALVAVALIAATALFQRRCRAKGLDEALGQDLLFITLVSGFVGAHLVAALTYDTGRLVEDPLLLLKIWDGLSSFGGIAGGALAAWLLLRARVPDRAARVAYLDAMAFVFPFAWTVGRLGCTVAHDHPGTITRFPLAVSLAVSSAQAFIADRYRDAGRLAELPPPEALAGMGFHDLGWYEFLYTALVLVPAFLVLDRRERSPGLYPAILLLLYAPVRFVLDFLRLVDARYLGLTPAQYACLAAVAVVVVLLVRRRPTAPPP